MEGLNLQCKKRRQMWEVRKDDRHLCTLEKLVTHLLEMNKSELIHFKNILPGPFPPNNDIKMVLNCHIK